MAIDDPKSLERWNRAGLDYFRYVDGNAATYLEAVRRALSSRLSTWATDDLDTADTPAESALRRTRRLEAQYSKITDDPLWEIARAFARGCHVLTEHVNAFANEGFVETATQWEYLRRQLYSLNHYPAPPASAVTRLVLLAKPGARGTLAAGLAVGSKGGSAPSLTFETIEEVGVDAELNALRVADYDRSPRALEQVLEVEGRQLAVAPGQPLLIELGSSGDYELHTIRAHSATDKTTRVALESVPHGNLGTARVWLSPRETLALRGPFRSPGASNVVRLEGPVHGFAQGQIVYVKGAGSGTFRRVSSVSGRVVTLEASVSGAQSMAVAPALPILSGTVAGDYARLAGTSVAYVASGVLTEVAIATATYSAVGAGTIIAGQTVLKGGSAGDVPATVSQVYIAPTTGLLPLAAPLDLALPLRVSRSKHAAISDFVVLEAEGQAVASARIKSIAVRGNSGEEHEWTLDFKTQPTGDLWASTARVVSGFREANLVDAHLNGDYLDARSLELADDAPGLTPGRWLIVEALRADKTERAFATRVSAIDGRKLIVEPPLPDKAFTKSGSVIRANTVLASHGKRQPETTLGSGDATRTSQAFVLEREGISFVPDATQPTGVRADVQVIVGNALWDQRGDLDSSGSTDPHYAVRVLENDQLLVQFGDGVHGRRLPTGLNNVRVRFRLGVGEGGNLAQPDVLTELMTPHALIAGVRQPLLSMGGNERESARSLRESAPAGTLTLGRAVSYTDLAQIAARHSSVAQAAAWALKTSSRFETVELVVVPAGALPQASAGGLGTLGPLLEAHVQAHAPAHVRVRAREFVRRPFSLKLSIGIDPRAARPAAVKAAVRAQLMERLSLSARRLGQSVSQGEIYALVERVEGITHSRIAELIGADGAPARWLPARPNELVFLDFLDPRGLIVDVEGQGSSA